MQSPIAYVEIDFHGGVGYQYGIVWRQGKITYVSPNNGWIGNHIDEQSPVNSALRMLGVKASEVDEVASLGILRHRQMENWFVTYTKHTVDEYYPDWMT